VPRRAVRWSLWLVHIMALQAELESFKQLVAAKVMALGHVPACLTCCSAAPRLHSGLLGAMLMPQRPTIQAQHLGSRGSVSGCRSDSTTQSAPNSTRSTCRRSTATSLSSVSIRVPAALGAHTLRLHARTHARTYD
jgi:hypothetical protein